jgi:DNA helicase-2/ATP-dependent DNA helicase PcrA
MGLDDFVTEEKTSSPKESGGPSEGGVDEFISSGDDDEIEVEGGFSIPKSKQNQYDTEVVKIFGGPGTGKTTTMVGNTEIKDFTGILQRMFEQRNPEEVMLIAYTRAAADEAKERLVKLTDVTKSKADERITTIHSLAMSFNNLTPKDIVEIRWSNDKYDFCQQVGMEYQLNADQDQEDMMATPDDEGHVFFQMNSWLKSKLMPPEEWEKCPLASAWSRTGEEFVEFAEEWESYKGEKGIWEFDDAILESVNNGDAVDTKFLFVDEVQDLYPLQQAFLDNHFGDVRRIFLAGDDDQTIYEWAGAKPEYFLNMEGKVNEEMPELWDDKTGYWEDDGVYILDQSWRMPDNILELAKMAIEKVSNRQEKEIKPHHEGGEFVPLHQPEPSRVIELINPEDTMILFRAKYQMSNFSDHMIEAGIPFKDRFKTWNEDIVALRDGIAALKNEQSQMSGHAAARIMREMPSNALEQGVNRDQIAEVFSSDNTIAAARVLDKIRYQSPEDYGLLRRWTSEFEDANWYQERAVRNNLTQHNEHLDPQGIRLKTIHGSKGREADTVILSTSSTQSVMENMPARGISDAERRLMYVGLTRTKNRLVMCEGLDEDSPTLTLDEILGTEWRDMYDWANGPVDDRTGPR